MLGILGEDGVRNSRWTFQNRKKEQDQDDDQDQRPSNGEASDHAFPSSTAHRRTARGSEWKIHLSWRWFSLRIVEAAVEDR